MECPKCGFPEAEKSCPRCGVVVERFLAAQREESDAAKVIIHYDLTAKRSRAPLYLALGAAVVAGAAFWFLTGGKGEAPPSVPRREATVPARAPNPVSQPYRQGDVPEPSPDPFFLATPAPAEPDRPGPSRPAHSPPASQYYSSTWLTGADGFQRGQEEQKLYNAPLVLLVYTDWCPYCRKLDRDYLTQFEVERYLNTLVKVRVNPDDGPAEKSLAQQYGVKGYPTLFLLGKGGGASKVSLPELGDSSGDAQEVADLVERFKRVAGAG